MAQKQGYRSKPLWIQLAALALILAPLGNIAISFQAIGLPIFSDIDAWRFWIHYVKPESWALNIMLFVAGIGLLWVRTWSFLLALIAIASVLIYNIVHFDDSLILGPVTFGVMLLVCAITLAIFLQKDFRKPYTNPRVRWWETSPRFRSDLPIHIKSAEKNEALEGTLLDISRSGALVELGKDIKLQTGDHVHLQLPGSIDLRSQVVRVTDEGSHGVQFQQLSWTDKRKLKTFVRQLATNPENFLR